MRFEKVDKKEEVIFSNRYMTVGDLRDMIKNFPDNIRLGHFEQDRETMKVTFCDGIDCAEINGVSGESLSAENVVYLKMNFGGNLV